ncbi:MAG: hypothetical protein VB092_04080 [Oscillospiraceae bacterium]|nr:hypothetical protein [Oscillospiraceae bacterium]
MLFTKDGHLTGETIRKLAGGTLGGRDAAVVAEHVAVCPACLVRLADAASAVIEPPRGWLENVRGAVRSCADRSRHALLRYCAVVAACVAICVGVVMTGTLAPVLKGFSRTTEIPVPAVSSVPAPGTDIFFKINAALAEAKKTTPTMEEPKNDPTKK